MWLSLCLNLLLSVTAAEPKPQPLPFSHKVHVNVGQKCLDCHSAAAKDEVAGFPPESRCMACHISIKKETPAIAKLAEFAKERTPVPWVRVYKIPEYVWFSHAAHVTNGKVECAACHGQVAEREVIVKEKPNNMRACMDCHESRHVSVACDFCHNPG